MAANGAPLFDDEQVIEIRKQFADGVSASALGRRFSVSYQTIFNMVRGESYRNVGGPITLGSRLSGKHNVNTRLTDADIIQIRDARSKGVPIKELAETFAVHASSISEAVSGKTWTHVRDFAPPFRLTKNGAEWVIGRLHRAFNAAPNAPIPVGAFLKTMAASPEWFSRQCQSGKIKTDIHRGVRVIRMRDAERFLRLEYGHL